MNFFKRFKVWDKKRYSKLNFHYGLPDFALISSKDNFYVDKTKYIRLIEERANILTFVRPEGFGKTTTLSMLDYYYNILYKNNFNELFGHLDIGKNPTKERNSYLIFRISFSSLDMNIESFEQSLNGLINNEIRSFINIYHSIIDLKDIIIDENDSIQSFISLTNNISNSKFRDKLYILIDEYHKLVDSLLSDLDLNRQDLMENIRSDQLDLFIRFFTIIKEGISTGVGRVFITGVIPIELNTWRNGFDVSTFISNSSTFEGLCGVYENDIEKVIDKENILIYIKNNYKGYIFNSKQSKKLYNTFSIIDLLINFFNNQKEIRNYINPFLLPSQETFDLITKFELSQNLIDELYQNGKIYISNPIKGIIPIKNMKYLFENNSLYVLSFLYYLGILTLSKSDHGSLFIIPNEIIKTLFIKNIQKRIYLYSKIELLNEINYFIKEKDISSICNWIKNKIFIHFNDNENENIIRTIFIFGFHELGRNTQSIKKIEYLIQSNIISINDKIHIEFKNIKMSEIILIEGIENLNEEELFNLKLKDSLDRNVNTIGDVWVNLLKKTKINHQWISNHFNQDFDSFAVLEIGLLQLKYEKIKF